MEIIDSGYNDRNIKKINKYIKKLNIFIVRVNNKNQIKSSAPCIYCSKVIKHLGFNKMIYSEDDSTFTECKPILYTKRHMSMGYIYTQYLKELNKGETFDQYKKRIKTLNHSF